MKQSKKLIIICLVMIFLLRFLNLNFPAFNADEARIAYRAYTLSISGKDELGRVAPYVFNSLEDYKLPATSYISALGVKIFGKSDLGVRIPFIILGTILAYIIYLAVKSFSNNFRLAIFSMLFVAFSPTLIFLSRVPNEMVVLTFLYGLLFYLLILVGKTKKRIFLIPAVFILFFALITSKYAFFINIPFTILCIYFAKINDIKIRSILLGSAFFLLLISLIIFLQIPQSNRSLIENNFSIFNDITIKNGIEVLRSQGIESGWPPLLSRALFNKLQYLTVGILHWFSHMSPNIFFGQFDKTGVLSVTSLGAFPKAAIIPTFLGFLYLLRVKKRETCLIGILILMTFPASLIYPKYSLDLLTLTLPFFAIIMAFGMIQLSHKVTILLLALIFFETTFNLFNTGSEIKFTNTTRPQWVNGLTHRVYDLSKTQKVFISDDVTPDIISFIEWLNPVDYRRGFVSVDFPYKYRQTSIANINLIGFDNSFFECTENEKMQLFLSTRDLDRVSKFTFEISQKYQDNLGKDIVFKIDHGICIR